MKLVKQETDFDCGYACLAMILNITLFESKKLSGAKELSGYLITKILKENKVNTDYQIKMEGFDLEIPKYGILNIPHKRKQGHWVVKKDDEIYCPHYGIVELKKYLKLSLGTITSKITIEENDE